MILEEFALLASDTARTKAYLQVMIQEDKLPGKCIVYSDNITKMQAEAEVYKKKEGSDEENQYFDRNIPVLFSLNESGIPYILVENKDINSNEICKILQESEQKYFIYSGYGGYILKPHLFHLNKKILHIHAGILPKYRGSTTAYYSFLQDKTLGATAIFLNEGIDEGEVVVQSEFGIPGNKADIDYIYEPYIRAQVLMKAVNKYLREGRLAGTPQKTDGAETYFIIHPLLKHLALLAIEKLQENKGDKNG